MSGGSSLQMVANAHQYREADRPFFCMWWHSLYSYRYYTIILHVLWGVSTVLTPFLFQRFVYFISTSPPYFYYLARR